MKGVEKNITNKSKTSVEVKKILFLIIFLIVTSITLSSLSIFYINKLDKSIVEKTRETRIYLKEYIILKRKSESAIKENNLNLSGFKNHLHLLLQWLNNDALKNEVKKTISEIKKIQNTFKNKNISYKETSKLKLNISKIESKLLEEIEKTLKDISYLYRKKQNFMILASLVVYIFSIIILIQIYVKVNKMQTHFKEQLVKIELLSKEKQDFLSTMSHEIRTPLNGIIGIIELLKLKSQDNETTSLLTKLETISNHLLYLINDILSFSKLTQKEESINEVEFNLDETISELIEIFENKAKENNTEIMVNIDPLLPIIIKGDKNKFIQIINNLVSNAVKFTKKEYIKIIVEREKDKDRRAFIRFTIEDSGTGIPENKLKSIFEPFKQISDPSKRSTEGTGLGLSICKKLVSLLGGEITIKSKVNKGTTVSFVLPFLVVKKVDEVFLETIKDVSICIYIQPDEELSTFYRKLFESFNLKSFQIYTSKNLLLNFLKKRINSKEKILILVDTDNLINNPFPGKEFLSLLNNYMALCFFGIFPDSNIPKFLTKDIELLKNKNIGVIEKPLTRSKILNIIMKFFSNRKDFSCIKPFNKDFEQKTKYLSNKKIMIVEDNTLNREILEKLFQNIGAKVIPCKNGVEALLSLNINKPDLIILDYHMPFMNGKECAEKIKEKGLDTPIILLSGDIFLKKTDGEKELFDAIITKPVDFKKLSEKVSFLINLNEKNTDNLSTSFPLLTNIYQNKKELNEVLKITKKDLLTNLTTIKENIKKKKLKTVRDLAHSLKGTISYFNSPDTVELLKKIENASIKEENEEKLLKLCSLLEKEIYKIIYKIENELNRNELERGDK